MELTKENLSDLAHLFFQACLAHHFLILNIIFPCDWLLTSAAGHTLLVEYFLLTALHHHTLTNHQFIALWLYSRLPAATLGHTCEQKSTKYFTSFMVFFTRISSTFLFQFRTDISYTSFCSSTYLKILVYLLL